MLLIKVWSLITKFQADSKLHWMFNDLPWDKYRAPQPISAPL
jgi:hypothetical protein